MCGPPCTMLSVLCSASRSAFRFGIRRALSYSPITKVSAKPSLNAWHLTNPVNNSISFSSSSMAEQTAPGPVPVETDSQGPKDSQESSPQMPTKVLGTEHAQAQQPEATEQPQLQVDPESHVEQPQADQPPPQEQASQTEKPEVESKDNQEETQGKTENSEKTETKVGVASGGKDGGAKKAPEPERRGDGGGGSFQFRNLFPASLKRWFSSESGPRRNREYYEGLSLEEKRKQYVCGSKYVTLDEIPTWEEDRKTVPMFRERGKKTAFQLNQSLNEKLIKKVSLWRGDITRLEIDSIVNAANSSLLGGGGVDGAIHRAASYSLREECETLGGCRAGNAKLSSGHRLPAKYILHTVGPIDCSEEKLRSCYTTCFQLVLQHNIRSVAFCCIATGVYGYPNKPAAHVALEVTREWLETEDNADKVDRIIFCVFLKQDDEIYKNLLQVYFPPKEEEGVPSDITNQQVPPAAVTTGDNTTESTDGNQTGGSKEEEEEEDKEEDKMETEPVTVPSLQKSITEPVATTFATKEPSEQQQQQVSPSDGGSPDTPKDDETDMEVDREMPEGEQESKRPKTESKD